MNDAPTLLPMLGTLPALPRDEPVGLGERLSGAGLIGASRGVRRRAQKTERKRWKRRDRVGYRAARRLAHDRAPIDYTLGERQADVFEGAEVYRFRVLIAGRRFGKTYLACVELIIAALSKAKSLSWYVAPTYRMAKDIAWDTLKELVTPDLQAKAPNESTLTVFLINGARIQLKGAEHSNRLRGRRLWFVVIDEFAMLLRKVWDEAIRPSLATDRGAALFISTPMGFNWAYDLFGLGKDPEKADWTSWQFTTLEGGRVTDDELAEARSILDSRVFRQEFEASFESLAGRVYDQFSRKAHVASERDKQLADDSGIGDILVGMDFNVNPMSAVLAQKRTDIGGKVTCVIFDVIELMSSNTQEMAEELRKRYPRKIVVKDLRTHTSRETPGRRIVVCPDPSGNSRKTSAPAGQTDFTILERAGFIVDAETQAPLVVDRVNNTQANLRDAGGEAHIVVHPRCAKLIKAWEGLTYKQKKDGTNQPDKTLGLDHVADAADYLLWQRFNRLNAYTIGYSKRRV